LSCSLVVEKLVLDFFLRPLRELERPSRYPGFPMPNEAALSESVRVTVLSRSLALDAGRDGFGAWSFRSSATERVCSAESVLSPCSSEVIRLYSKPSSPTEGIGTLSLWSRDSWEPPLLPVPNSPVRDLTGGMTPSVKGDCANRSGLGDFERSRRLLAGRGGITGEEDVGARNSLAGLLDGRGGTTGCCIVGAVIVYGSFKRCRYCEAGRS
jgi:hypothetical protein